ncbi:unnamed protein product [Rotaria sp. Silwood2]|nr:unnamed protein product [Rotaria sp. Silwood2]CAF4285854.1 unnamed protein product [Rotaria sp. Silwood2]
MEEPLSVNVFDTIVGTGKSISGINGQFIFAQVIMDCLLRLKYTQTDKAELIDRCKAQYEGNIEELNNVLEFEKYYSSDKALLWYTRETFLYKTVNAALRKQDIHMIFLFREFISDIIHQSKCCPIKHPLRAYRGQRMSIDELKALKKMCSHFISVNSFFSTTTDDQKACDFLDPSNTAINTEPVLFKIDADPERVPIKPFADVSALSEYPGEYEILFMPGSIFRLESIDRSFHGRIWVIQMTLCNDDEHEFNNVFLFMKQQSGSGETNLHTLGKIVWDMGNRVLAEKYFKRFIEQLSSEDILLVDLYKDLGKLLSQTGKWDESIEWHQKACTLTKQHSLISRSSIDMESKSLGRSPTENTLY